MLIVLLCIARLFGATVMGVVMSCLCVNRFWV